MSLSLQVIDTADSFALRLQSDDQSLHRRTISTLQLNIGKLCNLACHHCHVESGPKRPEIMTRQTIDQILDWLDIHRERVGIRTVDITGGAPEMNPHFRHLVAQCIRRGYHVIDRCNLTILLEPGYEDLITFLASHNVEISASLPCYLQDNVDHQRGRGVFHDSIAALHRLNAAGYGMPGSALRLDLVYNPTGYGLPPSQRQLQADYKRQLLERFGLHFHALWTITNAPIKRFEHALKRDGQFDLYMQKLIVAHHPANVEQVMCRDLISVGWRGTVYDCDFNQMLHLPIDGPQGDEHPAEREGRKLWDYHPDQLISRPIRTGPHCFACTAGAGSSCTGALA